jgi:hypothetical protein
MSSHHFVREGQEPALLILDPVELSLAEPLLEWAPMVIVTSQALETVLHWNIKIDIVIADAELSDLLQDKLRAQAPVKIIRIEDKSAFETALYFLIASKQSNAVSILTADIRSALMKAENFLSRLGINVLSESEKWSAISSGKFKKWLPAGSQLRFYGLSGAASYKNLKNLGQAAEVPVDGIVEVSDQTPFWVGETVVK